MHNPNSILPDTIEDHELAPNIASLSDMLYSMGNTVKDAKTALAVLALGAPNSVAAVTLAAQVEQFFAPHLPGTSYRMTFAGRGLLEIVAQTAQTNLTPEQRRMQVDLNAL